MRKLALIALTAALCGCQTIVITPPADCMAFVPDSWKLAVPGAQLPNDDTVQEWMKFGTAQSGQLSKANGRSADIIHIVTICEKRANDARPRRKVLGIF